MAKRTKYGVNWYLPDHPLSKGDASLVGVANHCGNCYHCTPMKALLKVVNTDMTDWGDNPPRNALLKCCNKNIGNPIERASKKKTFIKPQLITINAIAKCKLFNLRSERPVWDSLKRRGK